jgi:hypothetical protein
MAAVAGGGAGSGVLVPKLGMLKLPQPLSVRPAPRTAKAAMGRVRRSSLITSVLLCFQEGGPIAGSMAHLNRYKFNQSLTALAALAVLV